MKAKSSLWSVMLNGDGISFWIETDGFKIFKVEFSEGNMIAAFARDVAGWILFPYRKGKAPSAAFCWWNFRLRFQNIRRRPGFRNFPPKGLEFLFQFGRCGCSIDRGDGISNHCRDAKQCRMDGIFLKWSFHDMVDLKVKWFSGDKPDAYVGCRVGSARLAAWMRGIHALLARRIHLVFATAAFVHGAFNFFPGLPGALLDATNQFVFLSFNKLAIVICKLREFLLQLALGNVPVSFRCKSAHMSF
jgi:hypothetical protein